MARVLVAIALSGLGRDALKFVSAPALAIFLALAFSVSTLMTALGAAVPGHEVAGANTEEIPSEHLAVMRAAATETCGVPWQVIAAIAKVESNFGSNMATSSAGAIGYGQFLPSSWAAFGNGGDPYDYRDAIPASARYLCAHGAPHDLRRAVWAYNHFDSYVEMVLAIAARYGRGRRQSIQPPRIGVQTPELNEKSEDTDNSSLDQWRRLSNGRQPGPGPRLGDIERGTGPLWASAFSSPVHAGPSRDQQRARG